MHSFNYFCPTNILFGQGIRTELPLLLKSQFNLHVGLVIDSNLKEQTRIQKLIEIIKSSTASVDIGWCSVSEPTYKDLESARLKFTDKSLQVIIGIGGGSTLDMAKAMAVLVHNHGPAINYRGFDKMTAPVLPIIAVPTTAGTGSEVTPNASFIDSEEMKKLGINGEAVRPSYAFLDPELTLSCPLNPTISSGVDSMVHAVEAFVAKKTNQLARFFAQEGFQKVFTSLPQLVNDLTNIDLREEVMFGAFLSGIALMHSGTGPAAALSYPLSVHYGVPHGIGGGIFLPHIISHNINNKYSDYALLYNPKKDNNNETLEEFQQELARVWTILGIEDDLRNVGVKLDDINLITNETMLLKGALDQNPVPFYRDEIEATLKKLLGESHG